MKKALGILIVILCSVLTGQAQRLDPGKPVEREIAGGQSHTYQIELAAGQFVRFRLEQRAIDAALTLTAPDGKQLVEMNLTGLTGSDEEESVSLEVATAGTYRITVRGDLTARGKGAGPLRRSYRLWATVQASASASDRKRLFAEGLLAEAGELRRQRARTFAGTAEARRMSEQMVEKMQQALPITRELEEPLWTAYSLYLLGWSYSDLNQADKAIEYSEQAVAIFRELKLRSLEGDTLRILGGEYSQLGRAEKAMECREQALASYRAVMDRWAEAITLSNLGGAYFELGRHEKAIEYLEQAVAIFRELKDRFREGNALNSLGVFYTVLSRYEKAIECYEQALAIFREAKNRPSEGSAFINLGRAYSWLGRVEKAIEYYEQALAIYREIKIRLEEGNALNHLGRAYSVLGDNKKAIEYHEQALAIYREAKNRPAEGTVLNDLGIVYHALGRNEKAIEFYEQSLAIMREVQNRRNQGDTLLSLGDAYYSLGRLDEAVRYHEQALLFARELKAQARESRALYRLAADELDRGNLARARTLIEESLTIAESIRAESISKESRAGFLATVQGVYQLYTDLLMRQHRAEPAKGLDALAVEVSERQRTRSLLDQLREARIDIRQGVDAALLERERSLGRQLNDRAQQLMQARKPEQVDALKKEISQLENDYERAQAEIRKASPHYAALVQPQPLKLKEIQAQLDADTLLLEYALGAKRSYLWAITKDSLKSFELPRGEQIKQSALQVYEFLTARSASKRGESAVQRLARIGQAEAKLPAAARDLSQTLLGPIVAEFGNKRLVIVADGALQYIPFAMLPEPETWGRGETKTRRNGGAETERLTKNPRVAGSRLFRVGSVPLIVRHEVISLPSASALAIQRSELAGRQPAPKMLAVIADPVFDRSDSRFTTPATETGDKTQMETQTIGADDARSIEHLAENSDDKSGVKTLRLVIPRLPFTRQEANQLMALAPKVSSFSAIDFQATRATALDPALSQYRYLHFATHGLLDSERPSLSALVFSMVDAEGKPQNGFLRANDIYNLKLPAELVVLSACQTGLGKEIKGEGLVGLTRGFMYAGAARVVVSLWNVNDEATADLMTKFYEKMLKQSARPAAALRAAQVEMWRQKQWQSPYYWAAFTMQGEWR